MGKYNKTSIGESYTVEHRRKRNWKKVVAVLSCFVIVGTVSALTLPAITMNQPACGLEEHQHSEECNGEVSVLACNAEIHQHTEDCRDAEGNLICHYADFVIHKHDGACYDAQGGLICSLPEIKEHQHDDSCYQLGEDIIVDAGHQHNDQCYSWTTSETPACGLEASEGHTHDETCRSVANILTCTEVEEAGHTHDESCSDAEGNLICELEEKPGHQHSDSCYTQQETWTCEQEESTGHQHDDACFRVKGDLSCTEQERDPVTEPGERVLICDQLQAVPHTHGGTCYWEDALVCEKTEVLSHQHAEECFTTEQAITCGKTEHTHDDSCKPETALTEEEQRQVEDVISIIAGLPPVAEIESEFDRLAENAEELAAYRVKIIGAVRMAFDEYAALTDAQKAAVTNADQLPQYSYLLEDQPKEPDYTVSDGNTSANVKLNGFAMPEGTTFCLESISGDSEHYQNAENQLSDYMYNLGGLLLDFQLMDVHFAGSDGAEIEPEGEATVTLTFAEPILPGRDTIRVLHFGEAGIEDVTGEVESGIEGVHSVTFTTSSFSDIAVAAVVDQENIGEVLNGDYAYLSDVKMVADTTTDSGYSVRTGTSPWDADNAAGNDNSDLNNILRTFDIATYNVSFTSRVRENAPSKFFNHGDLYFEFVLPGDSEQVQFETGSMPWLAAKNAIYTVTQESVNGKTSQVLRGKYTWYPAPGNNQAIGEATQELNIAVRVLAMHNGETVQPQFTFFLDHNQVGVDYSAWGTAAYSGGTVTGNGESCAAHGQEEQQTIAGPKLTVSAAPRFDVEVVTEGTTNVGVYDFNTGATNAPNYGIGQVRGRLMSFGFVIQVTGKSNEQGLRGVEFPKNGEDITFEVDLSSEYEYYLNSVKTTVDTTSDYTPLVWDTGANIYDPTEYNRKLNYIFGVNRYVPFNRGADESSQSIQNCYNGGTWSARIDGNKIYYTISGYEIRKQLNYFPSGNAYSNEMDHEHYNRVTAQNYWDVWDACISAGKLYVVQPYDEKTANGGFNGTYVAEKYDVGTYRTKLTAGNLDMTVSTGEKLPAATNPPAYNNNQSIMWNDTAVMSAALVLPGDIDSNLQYMSPKPSSWNSPLTEGCWGNGRDWVLAGNPFNVFFWTVNDNAEMENTGVAYEHLLKFDDKFVDPQTVRGSEEPMCTWAAKPDKSGWASDEEMKRATSDDLVFFRSLDELERQGYTCVGVLMEHRRLSDSYVHLDNTLLASARRDAEPGKVYMMSHYARAWHRGDLANACAQSEEYSHLTLNDILAMSDEEVKPIIDALIPTRYATAMDSGNAKKLTYANDYPNGYYIKGGWDGTTKDTVDVLNYTKPSYDAAGNYISGTEGWYWGDSCLLVSYITNVQIEGAQKAQNETGNEITKESFDMDTYQRYVDYVVSPSFVRSAGDWNTPDQIGTTTATVTVTLPASLTYLENSSYIGGTYIQNGQGVQGDVEGGTLLREGGSVTYTDSKGNQVMVTMQLKRNDDGTTTLTYTMDGVGLTQEAIQMLDQIHFSCLIGTPGQEETDVVDGQEISVQATIFSTKDNARPFTSSNGNLSTEGILINKRTAVNLSKFADQAVVELQQEMGFSMNVGNNSTNSQNILAVDSLPYNGDGVSSFTGSRYVTEFCVTNASELDMGKIKFYYTMDTSERGKVSQDYTADGFSNTTKWIPLTLDGNGSAAIPGDTFEPVSIVAVGMLDGGKSLKMHITLKLPEGKAGEYVVNTLTNDNLSSSARCRIVSRSLEGLTWIDDNHDGIQNNRENRISDVTVTLLKMDENGVYQEIATIQTGQKMDVLNMTAATDYEPGRYLLENLMEGTYAVKFTSGATDISYYHASPVNVGSNDTIDSDAVPTYNADSTLQQTLIEGIVMPPAKELTYATYHVANEDSGFYTWGPELPQTGGPGTSLYIFSGLLLMGAAALIYKNRCRKRKEAK